MKSNKNDQNGDDRALYKTLGLKRNLKKITICIVGFLIGYLIVSWYNGIDDYKFAQSFVAVIISFSGVVLIFSSIIYLILFIFHVPRCPYCGAKDSKIIGSEYYDSEIRHEIVKRNIYNKKGDIIGNYDSGENIQYDTYTVYRQCKVCNHTFISFTDKKH